MKKLKIRSFLMLVLLPGCALFSPPKDNTKIITAKLADIMDEAKLQREEIRLLHLKLKSMEETKKAKPVAKLTQRKTTKTSDKNKAKKSKKILPVIKEEDATIADSSHEELHKYFKGVQLIREKKIDDGLNQLREFIAENPNHVYADRAEMLIADTHLKSKDYGLVIVSTNVLENRYPHSIKLPEALYKRAMAFMALDQKDQAKKTLEKILNDYPGSKIAEMAEKRMASLKAPLLTDVP